MKSRWIAVGLVVALAGVISGCEDKPVRLSWEDTSADEEGFRIYRVTKKGKTLLAEVASNVTTYTDESPLPDSCYLVTAFNAAGESEPTNFACREPASAMARSSR